MPLANPIAFTTGSADVSSAAPPPHTRPVTPSPATPFVVPPSGGPAAPPARPAASSLAFPHDKSQRAFERAVLNSVTPSRLALRAALASAPHFVLFMDVLRIAFIVLQAITRRMHADLDCLTLLQGCQAAHCLYSIIRIKLAVELHPERITEAELRRLAKASRYINRLARRKLDFSPYTDIPSATHSPIPGTADGPVRNPAHADQSHSPSPNNPQSENSQSVRPRTLHGIPAMSASYAPGATLAGVCQTLARLLKLLPDLEYDPDAPIPANTPEFPTGSADVPSASTPPHTHPAHPSPTPGARTPSSAPTPSHTHPVIPSPSSPGARASSLATTPTPNTPATSQQNALISDERRQPCCRFSSPTPLPSSSHPAHPANSAHPAPVSTLSAPP